MGRGISNKMRHKNDGKFRPKGRIQVNHIPGDNAQPVNDAEAYSSCTNCETFAIALQVDLISRTATTIAPQNIAVAVNYQCSHCSTSARAIQYVIRVDDPTQGLFRGLCEAGSAVNVPLPCQSCTTDSLCIVHHKESASCVSLPCFPISPVYTFSRFTPAMGNSL